MGGGAVCVWLLLGFRVFLFCLCGVCGGCFCFCNNFYKDYFMTFDTLFTVFFILLVLSLLFLGGSSYLKAIVLLEVCVLLNFMYLSFQVSLFGDLAGLSFLFYVLAVAASETSVGFALLVAYYKNVGSISFSPLSRN